jgi:hypothetical protein
MTDWNEDDYSEDVLDLPRVTGAIDYDGVLDEFTDWTDIDNPFGDFGPDYGYDDRFDDPDEKADDDE